MKYKIICLFTFIKVFAVSGLLLTAFCAKPIDRYGMAAIKASGKKSVMGQKDIVNAAPMEVTLQRDFAIDRTEITTGFYTKIMGNSPSFFNGDTSFPVEKVSFIDAALFCNRRSVKEGLTPCYNAANWSCDPSKSGFRLPSEAEWEYACRAGSKTEYFWGKRVSSEYCWYSGNSNNATHPVATKKPNKFGLFDMSGNVWEWCDDHFVADRTGGKTEQHWELGPKTLKGGSWSSPTTLLGSAVRDGGDPMGKSNGVGFRCVRTL
jgi:formylglycine-generating enzyme required for sulfatase activity